MTATIPTQANEAIEAAQGGQESQAPPVAPERDAMDYVKEAAEAADPDEAANASARLAQEAAKSGDEPETGPKADQANDEEGGDESGAELATMPPFVRRMMMLAAGGGAPRDFPIEKRRDLAQRGDDVLIEAAGYQNVAFLAKQVAFRADQVVRRVMRGDTEQAEVSIERLRRYAPALRIALEQIGSASTAQETEKAHS